MAGSPTGVTDAELARVTDVIITEHRRGYFLLGTHLGSFDYAYLTKVLQDEQNDEFRALMHILIEFRSSRSGDVRAELLKALHKVKFFTAFKIVQDGRKKAGKAKYKKSAPDPANSSSGMSTRSYGISKNVDDDHSDTSMVTSAHSRDSSDAPEIEKESEFGSSASLSTPLPSILAGTSQRVADWLGDVPAASPSLTERHEAPSVDMVSDVSEGQLQNLQLRDYQWGLAEPALAGHNTAIVAPTGSGKTYIAVAVAQKVLSKSGMKAKVVILVNQVPLVHQRRAVFKKYLLGVEYLCGDCGQQQTPRLPLAQLLGAGNNVNVVVLTAQILQDALENDQVSLEDIGLLILDECHETKKESPYNKIMGRYLMMKKKQGSRRLPQILGLTASMGIGNARDDVDACKYILNLCANMDVHKISVVQEHKGSLAQVENRPRDDTHIVTDRKNDAFADEISKLIQLSSSIIDKKSGRVFTGILKKLQASTSRHSKENTGHIICKLTRQILEMEPSSDEYFALMTAVEYLKAYSVCLSIHQIARTKDALTHLQHFMEEKKKKGSKLTKLDQNMLQHFNDREQELIRISQTQETRNPALVELQKLIVAAYSSSLLSSSSTNSLDNEDRSPDAGADSFRAIIFTETVESTWALKKWVLETESLKHLHPEVLTGSRNPGMTLDHQTDVLNKLRCGVHKLLIATSVAQQGIDISSCDFVFSYNYISDAVGWIQARGRTRTRGGGFELVVHENKRLHEKDELCQEQETRMKEATEHLATLSVEDMKIAVTEYQRTRDVRTNNPQQCKKPLDVYNRGFYCRKCVGFVCHSHDVRIVEPGGHHVIIKEQSFAYMKVQEAEGDDMKEKRHWGSITHSGKEIRCTRCDWKWGSILRCKFGLLLAISVRSFCLKVPGQKAKLFSKWGQVPFTFRKESVEKAAIKQLTPSDAAPKDGGNRAVTWANFKAEMSLNHDT